MGRKVFFVNPPFYVTNTIIPRLTALEYEVFSLDSYKIVKSVLKKYPDSICFLNIDCEDLSFTEWFNFSNSFENDPILSSVFFGVISQRAPKPTRENFLLNINLPAGFIQYTPDLDALVSIFDAILKINGAMGKRKFIRADCGKDPSIYLELDLGITQLPLMIENISSSGVAVYIPEKNISMLQVNTQHKVILHLRDYVIPGAVTITMLREIAGTKIGIMMFGNGISLTNMEKLRTFIRIKIQKNLDAEFDGLPLDETDYSNLKNGSESEDENSENENEIEELDEAELLDGLEELDFNDIE